MTTIKEIKETISLEELRKEEEENNKRFPDWAINSTDSQLLDAELYSIICSKIKKASTQKDFKEYRKGVLLNENYVLYFDNEEILNTLRQLYISTKNNFVKNVIKTVGQAKKCSEKQLAIIIDEMMKFNLNINF